METFDGQARNLDEGPGLLQSAWRYRWVVAVAALLGLLAGYGWETRQPTLYEATSRLFMSPGPGDVPAVRGEPERFLSNQAALMASWPVVQRAAEASPGTPPGLLSQRMRTQISEDADLIAIHVLAPTGEEAKRLADAVGVAYDKFVKQSSRDAARAEVKQLEAASLELSGKLVQLDAAIQASPGDRRLQANRRAVEEQLDATAKRSQQLATQARIGVSRVALRQEAPIPRQPVQPTPSRGAALGLLLGLVGSSVLAWLLNSRRAVQPGWAEPDRAPAGRGWPPEPEWRTAPALVAGNGNGAQRTGVGAVLGRWLTGERPGGPNRMEGIREGEAFEWRQADAASSAGNGRRGAVSQPVESGGSDLRDLLARIDATLEDELLGWYLDNLPQRMAEALTMRVYADVVALLLDRADGPFELAGGIGITPDEQAVAVDVDNEILREALRQGVSVFQDGNPMPTTAGLPGSRDTEALVVTPLVEGSSWLGMLLVGRRSTNGNQVAAFTDQEVERIILYAMEISPTLQALLLLHRLRGPLRSLVSPAEAEQQDDADPDRAVGSG
jgi:hypothetical protein